METTLETGNSEFPDEEKLFSHVPRVQTPSKLLSSHRKPKTGTGTVMGIYPPGQGQRGCA